MEGAFWKILIPAKQGAILLKLYFNLSIDLDFRVFICFMSSVGSTGFHTEGEPTFNKLVYMQRSTMNYKKARWLYRIFKQKIAQTNSHLNYLL